MAVVAAAAVPPRQEVPSVPAAGHPRRGDVVRAALVRGPAGGVHSVLDLHGAEKTTVGWMDGRMGAD
jgi:hypothetical protein